MLISTHHAELYRQYYASRNIPNGMNMRAPEILALAKEIHAQTALDYGCGRGSRLEDCLSGLRVHSYDPGILEFSERPPSADLVCCLDVLEHVEPDYVDGVIEDIKKLAIKAVYLTVSCQDSGDSKLLPDGSKWHSFVRPVEWWSDRLPEYQNLSVDSKRFIGVYRWA